MNRKEKCEIRVLLIDDDEDDYLLTRYLLAEIREPVYDLTWISLAEEALPAIERREHDICLLDYRLNGCTGLELLQTALARGCEMPVIMLTGRGDHHIDIEAMQAGATDYLVKGKIDAQLLERSIRYAIERKRAEAERTQLLLRAEKARLAEEANRAKDDFIATISHELRSPLNVMLGWVRLMRKGNLDEETMLHALDVLERNTRVQSEVIEDLLDISRIVAGKLTLNMVQVELPPVIEAAIEDMRPAVEAKNIRLHHNLDKDVGVISGDPQRLHQIVWNLLSNAIKFTPAGGKIEISLMRAGSHACIQVRDTGEGISEDFLPFVFERFRQAPTTDNRTHKGLGVGLAIVRHLMQMHGGTIAAESAGQGQGALFTIMFPIPAVRIANGQNNDAPLAWEERLLLRNPPTLDGVRVLVVDDETDARELVTTVLEQCGAQVTAVNSVAAALARLSEVISEERPDVLISDIGMTTEDGYSLMRKVRALEEQRGGHIPAAALTAYAGEEDRRQSFAAGYEMHVPKPVEPARLAAVVANLAGWHYYKKTSSDRHRSRAQ